jgi:hypothetical protein
MKRLLPWVLAVAVYGGLLSAIGMMIPEWIATTHALVTAGFVLLYAAVTSTFGPWRALGLAAVPALWILDLALFMDAAAFDCYPNCTTYHELLRAGLSIGAGLCLLVLLLAVLRIARRQSSRRRHRPLYD